MKRTLVTGGAGFIGSHLCERLLELGGDVLCVDNFVTGARWGNVNPVGPRSRYDEGKRCAETLFFDYRRQHGLEIKVARIFSTYGPWMSPNDGRVVSNFIIQALRGKPISVYGDGRQTRSFCYVSDLIDGLIRLMGSPGTVTGPINLGNLCEFTILDLAALVIKATGAAVGIEHQPLPHDDPKQRRPDISQARELLGWTPTVPLKEGLKRTIDYFRQIEPEGALERGGLKTGSAPVREVANRGERAGGLGRVAPAGSQE